MVNLEKLVLGGPHDHFPIGFKDSAPPLHIEKSLLCHAYKKPELDPADSPRRRSNTASWYGIISCVTLDKLFHFSVCFSHQ